MAPPWGPVADERAVATGLAVGAVEGHSTEGQPAAGEGDHPHEAAVATDGQAVAVEQDRAGGGDGVGEGQEAADGGNPTGHVIEGDHHPAGEEHDDHQRVVEHLDPLPDQGQRADDERVADAADH